MLISGTNSTNASANGSSGVMKNFMAIRMMNRLNMLLSVQSQSIQNKGEISGIKQQQQNALETQEDNEEEYQKEHRHRILHAIISIFTHIVNIVMTVLRPVKHIAKAVSKSLSKALNKGIKKATNGMMKHFGLAKPMQRVGKGVQ